MAEIDQLPAPPAAVQTLAPSESDAPQTKVERAQAKPIEFKRAPIYSTLKDHLAEANHPEATVRHPRVHEHAELRGLKHVPEKDAITGEVTMRPAWQVRVLLAWWKGHGLEHHSRISPQHFDEALHEALHGRI